MTDILNKTIIVAETTTKTAKAFFQIRGKSQLDGKISFAV